jgi:hypothetical protein
VALKAPPAPITKNKDDMKNWMMRLLRGQYPTRYETWQDYMQRDVDKAMIPALILVVMGVGLALLEAIDRGLA